MERLSSLDASFLYRETPTNPLHLGAVFIVELNSKNPDQFFRSYILIYHFVFIQKPTARSI